MVWKKNQLQEENWEKHRHMGTKQYTNKNKGLMNKSKRYQKLPSDKWKLKHNSPKPMWCSKSKSKKEVYNNISIC